MGKSDTIFITHNRKLYSLLKEKNKTYYLPSPISNRWYLNIAFFPYYFLVYLFSKVYLRFSDNISKVYHDIQGYGISEYILIREMSKQYSIYRYTDVKLPLIRKSSNYFRLFGLDVRMEKTKNETFYYFPNIPGKLLISQSEDDKNRLNNTTILYLGGVVEYGLMNKVEYKILIKKILIILKNKKVRIKFHPRFKTFEIPNDSERDHEILDPLVPAEHFIGFNCSGIGFQTYSLCDGNLIKSISLLDLCRESDQINKYKEYLSINSNFAIKFPKSIEELNEEINQFP